jgi:hypothetical protein
VAKPTRKRSRPSFRPGRSGACEALLFEITGTDPLGERKERIAASTLQEISQYLQSRDPDFHVTTLQNVGLVVLLSGSPLD